MGAAIGLRDDIEGAGLRFPGLCLLQGLMHERPRPLRVFP